jgi:hypothetical protein
MWRHEHPYFRRQTSVYLGIVGVETILNMVSNGG